MRQAKRIAIIFGIIGYAIAVWNELGALYPASSDVFRRVLWAGCVGCSNFTTLQPRYAPVLLFFAPINGLVYAAVAFAVVALLYRFAKR